MGGVGIYCVSRPAVKLFPLRVYLSRKDLFPRSRRILELQEIYSNQDTTSRVIAKLTRWKIYISAAKEKYVGILEPDGEESFPLCWKSKTNLLFATSHFFHRRTIRNAYEWFWHPTDVLSIVGNTSVRVLRWQKSFIEIYSPGFEG